MDCLDHFIQVCAPPGISVGLLQPWEPPVALIYPSDQSRDLCQELATRLDCALNSHNQWPTNLENALLDESIPVTDIDDVLLRLQVGDRQALLSRLVPYIPNIAQSLIQSDTDSPLLHSALAQAPLSDDDVKQFLESISLPLSELMEDTRLQRRLRLAHCVLTQIASRSPEHQRQLLTQQLTDVLVASWVCPNPVGCHIAYSALQLCVRLLRFHGLVSLLFASVLLCAQITQTSSSRLIMVTAMAGVAGAPPPESPHLLLLAELLALCPHRPAQSELGQLKLCARLLGDAGACIREKEPHLLPGPDDPEMLVGALFTASRGSQAKLFVALHFAIGFVADPARVLTFLFCLYSPAQALLPSISMASRRSLVTECCQALMKVPPETLAPATGLLATLALREDGATRVACVQLLARAPPSRDAIHVYLALCPDAASSKPLARALISLGTRLQPTALTPELRDSLVALADALEVPHSTASVGAELKVLGSLRVGPIQLLEQAVHALTADTDTPELLALAADLPRRCMGARPARQLAALLQREVVQSARNADLRGAVE